jgi:hypothetical protein
MNEAQHAESLRLPKGYLSDPDWIVRNTSMKVLHEYCEGDQTLKTWLMAQFTQMQNSEWKSFAGRAKKLLAPL